VLLGVVFIVFSIMSLTPGDPATNILGTRATPEAIAQLNHELGYDRPFLARFLSYVGGIVTRFDFGTSYTSGRPVLGEILVRFPATLTVSVLAMLVSAAVGVSLGVLAAVRQYSALDSIATFIAMVFAAIPGFWFGLMLILLFSLRLGWLPPSGIDTWHGYVLPTVTLSLSGAAGLLRMTRTQMLETIRQDYTRTARAKGAAENTVIWKHALKNALLPVITTLGWNFGSMLGGAIIAETVFALPGLGQYMLTKILAKDVPAVMSSTLFFAALFCLIMLGVDILYAFIDPRIKAKYTGGR
jgi:peptide/nickel transport system permease protein